MRLLDACKVHHATWGKEDLVLDAERENVGSAF